MDSTPSSPSTANFVLGGAYSELVGQRGLGQLKIPSISWGSWIRLFSFTPQSSMMLSVARRATRAMRSISFEVR